MTCAKSRKKYLKSVALIALMSAPCPLYAQAAQEPAAEPAADAEAAPDQQAPEGYSGPDIIVTGSSIRGAPAVGSNLISVGRDTIEDNAVQTVQQLLKTVPAIWGGNAASQGGFSANDAAGASVPQIHGIGGANSSSTLVVIDGHRFPLTGIIRNLPDPNFIPPNAIERVEVLAEGASSIYGSDAVAGVLNFITRRKFEGVEASGQYGFADDYKNWSATLSLGTRWETGGGAVFYSYSDRGRLAIADRPFVGSDQRSRGGSNFGTFACSPASIQPAGQSLIFLYPYNQPGIVNAPANAPCDPVGRSDLIPQERRHSVMVKLDQEVGDRLTLSGDVAFSSRSSEMQTSVTVAHGQGSTPTVPQVITATAFGPGSGMGGQINPFYVNPTGSNADRQTVRWDGNDLFPDGARQRGLSETFYGHARAEYELSDDWRVAGFVVAGVNTAKTTITGSICQACFLLALNGSTNGNGNLSQPSIPNSNVFVNNVPLTVDNAIDVWNPRATNRTSPEVLRRLQDSRTYQASRQVMQQYNITVNGTLFALPGGDVKVAVGGDLTKYSQQAEVVDSNGTGPASTGSNYVAVEYRRTVKSVFGELLIPVIGEDMEIPGVRSLVLNVSGRYDHYDEFGSIDNPKFAFNWEVIDGLKIRGNYATSFVAPQFSTYGPDIIRGVPGLSVDSFFGPYASQLNLPLDLYPEARALPGCTTPGQVTCVIGSGSALNGMVIEGANPNVKPATGKTWAIGADFTPRFLPGFSASLTYWHTTVNGTSGSPPIGIVANSELFHDLIKIYPNGATAADIEALRGSRRQRSPLASGNVYFSVDARNQNIYNLIVEGIDFDVKYRHAFDWGAVRVGVNGTYKTRFDQTAGDGEPVFSVLNRNRFNGTFPSNQLDARADLGIDVGPVSATFSANHTGSYTFWGNTALNPVTSSGGIPNGGGDPVKAYTTVDMNLTYDLSDVVPGNIQLFANVDNIFDAMPPFVNVSGNQALGFGFDALLAFPMGRVITLGVRAKF